MKKSTWIWIGLVTIIIIFCYIGSSKKDKAIDKWANSPGTNGFINLDEVQKAAIENSKTEDFEKRVNEIFEGDKIILIDIQGRQKGFVLTGVEDLNGNGTLEISPGVSSGAVNYNPDNIDEVVFQLTVTGQPPNNATLVGKGVNKDFSKTFDYPLPATSSAQGDSYHRRYGYYPYPYFYYGRHGSPYRTPYAREQALYAYRRNYRSSSSYRTQIVSNDRYMGAYSSRYPNSAQSFNYPSQARNGYVTRAASSPGFHSRISNSSTAQARSGMPSSGSSRSSGFKSNLGSSARSSYSSSRASSGFRIF